MQQRHGKKPFNRATQARHAGHAKRTPASIGSDAPSQVVGSAGTSPGKILNLESARALITRRNLLIGAAGVAAVAGVAFGANRIADSIDEERKIPVLNLSADSVESAAAYDQVEMDACVALQSRVELPYGSLVWSSCPTVAACLLPTETASPLTKVALWSITSGLDVTVLDEAIGTSQGYEIYDVRATDQAIIWTEANILQESWCIYSASVSELALGEPVLMESGNCSEWETPGIAAVGPYVYWQLLPNVEGPFATEQSTLRKAKAGATSFSAIVHSTGRMATAPYALVDGIVVTPRADAEGVFYQPTLLDAKTDEVLDTFIMPQNMKPQDVGYGKNGFIIAMGAIYDFNDGLSNLGCFSPTVKPAEAAQYSTVKWVTYTRQPSAPPCWSGPWFIVKSTQAVCGFDPESRKSFVIDPQNGSEDWGDYLATTGISDTIVTFAHVDYTPLNSGVVHAILTKNEEGESKVTYESSKEQEDPLYCTLVRAWKTMRPQDIPAQDELPQDELSQDELPQGATATAAAD